MTQFFTPCFKIFQIFSGFSGMSTCRTPNGRSASITEFTTAVVHREVVSQTDLARLAVDLGDRDVRAEGKCIVRRLKNALLAESRLDAGRKLLGKNRLGGNFQEGHGLLPVRSLNLAVPEFEFAGFHAQLVRRDAG